MAIVVQCHQCGKILHLDDGFRGGVCRCGGCGTLLRVPTDAGNQVQTSRPDEPNGSTKATERPESPLQDPGLSRGTLTGKSSQRPVDPVTSSGAFASSGMRNRPNTPLPPPQQSPASVESNALSGLAALAAMTTARTEAKTTSPGQPKPQPAVKPGGLGIKKTTENKPPKPQTKPQATAVAASTQQKTLKPVASPLQEARVIVRRRSNPLLLWIFIGAGLIFVATVVWILVMVFGHGGSGRSSANSGNTSDSGSGGASTVVHSGPRFLQVPLVGRKIVFSLDGSSANTNSFNLVAYEVKTATSTLSPGQKFKIAIWRGKHLKLLPTSGWVTNKTGKATIHSLMNFVAYGSSDAAICMPGSLQLGGDQIIFVTAKIMLPDHIAKIVAAARTHAQRIDTISVDGERKELAKIAMSSDGVFRKVSNTQLQDMANSP